MNKTAIMYTATDNL